MADTAKRSAAYPPDETYYAHFAPLLALAAESIFLAVKTVPFGNFFRVHPRLSSFMRWSSAESYNVYLMHVAFVVVLAKGWRGFTLTALTGGTPFIGVPTTLAAVLVSSWTLSTLIQRVPLLSRILVIPVAISPN